MFDCPPTFSGHGGMSWADGIQVMVPHGHGERKSPTVLNPYNFDPTTHLPLELWPRADGARYVLGTIMRKEMYGRTDDGGYVRLSSRVMREMIGRNTWQKTIMALRPCLETQSYIKGVRCRGYKVVGLGNESRRVPLQDPELAGRIWQHRDCWRQEQEARLLPIHKSLRSNQRKHLTLAPEVEVALGDLPERSQLVQRALVRAIRERRTGFSVSNTGRVFNGITGMKRELREYVHLAGEPVVETDIRASQPSLLGQLFATREVKGLPGYSVYLAPDSPSTDSAKILRSSRGVASRISVFFDRLPALLSELGEDAFDFTETASCGVLRGAC